MSYHSMHMKSVSVGEAPVGTELASFDSIFTIPDEKLFGVHPNLDGNTKFSQAQVMVAYVKAAGILHRAAVMVGYAQAESGNVVAYVSRLQKTLCQLNFYRIVKCIARTRCIRAYTKVRGWGDFFRNSAGRSIDLVWQRSLDFEIPPMMNAYADDMLHNKVNFEEDLGGPNAAKETWKAMKAWADGDKRVMMYVVNINEDVYRIMNTKYMGA